jgi:hypothetical protein
MNIHFHAVVRPPATDGAEVNLEMIQQEQQEQDEHSK